MNKTIFSLCMAGALALPGWACAKPVTLTTTMKNYDGDGAYLAIYLTDSQGRYEKTLWVSGKKAKYYKHLRNWARGSGLNSAEFDGVSGASVGSGKSLEVTVDIADTLIDAGYEVRIDTAVEDARDNPAEVRAPLTSTGAGAGTPGRGYVQLFTYDL